MIAHRGIAICSSCEGAGNDRLECTRSANAAVAEDGLELELSLAVEYWGGLMCGVGW
jgi:hypothetical protein